MKKFLVNVFKTALIAMSFTTMTFSELAQAKENERINKQRIQSAIVDLGLNKPMTFGQFFEKNKHLFPERVQKELRPLLAEHKNIKMPVFKVTEVKTSKGEVIPTIRTDVDGKLVNIQMFGEKDRYAKFQNTNLAEVDLVNFTDMMSRIYYGDASFRREAKTSSKPIAPPIRSKATSFAQFKGFAPVNYSTWNKFSPLQRAQYLTQVRLMYLDAKRVNLAFAKSETKPGKKTVEFPVLEKLFGSLVEIAQAENFTYGENCVVAGYLGTYEPGINNKGNRVKLCSVQKAIQSSRNKSEVAAKYVEKANRLCTSANYIACNPLIYGYESADKAICVDKLSAEFQSATHAEGPCDTKSRLTSENFIKAHNFDKEYDLSKRSSEIEKIKKDSENAKESARLLRSVINNQSSDEIKSFLTKKPLSRSEFEKLKAEIEGITKVMNEEIESAVQICSNELNNLRNPPVEQKKACDQLHRRYVNSKQLIEELDANVSEPPTQVNPPTVPPSAEPRPEPPVGDCDSLYPGAGTQVGGSGKCVCPVGSNLVLVATDVQGAQSWRCEALGAGKPIGGADECGFFCKLWGGTKKILPFALAGLGIFALYKVMMPKKPALNPAGDRCPDGSIPNPICITTCGPTQVMVNGVCSCAACPPGQTITDASTCMCSPTGGGGGGGSMVYTCADGTTKVPSLDQCPKPLITCWDGSKVENALMCPEKPLTPLNKPVKTGQ